MFKPIAQIIEEPKLNRFYAAVTGHRPDKLGGYAFHTPIRDNLRVQLRATLLELQAECAASENKPDLWLITGCALGFDQDAAGVAYRLGIPYLAAVPFEGQDSIWPDQSRIVYKSVLAHASQVDILIKEKPSQKHLIGKALTDRNKWMVDRAHVLIAAWNGTQGGTAHCVRYAQTMLKRMIMLEVR